VLVEPRDALLSGRVIETQFFGGVSTVAITVAGHDVPVLLTRQGAPSAVRDAEVHLSWDPAKAVVLSA
jgi:spermidine/putrescine transport system ATP-binding protein/putrescine transport system ATP-binding protein